MIPADSTGKPRLTLRLNTVSTGRKDSDWERESIYGNDGR